MYKVPFARVVEPRQSQGGVLTRSPLFLGTSGGDGDVLGVDIQADLFDT